MHARTSKAFSKAVSMFKSPVDNQDDKLHTWSNPNRAQSTINRRGATLALLGGREQDRTSGAGLPAPPARRSWRRDILRSPRTADLNAILRRWDGWRPASPAPRS